MTWLKLTRRVLRRIAWYLRAELYQLAYRAQIASSELSCRQSRQAWIGALLAQQ